MALGLVGALSAPAAFALDTAVIDQTATAADATAGASTTSDATATTATTDAGSASTSTEPIPTDSTAPPATVTTTQEAVTEPVTATTETVAPAPSAAPAPDPAPQPVTTDPPPADVVPIVTTAVTTTDVKAAPDVLPASPLEESVLSDGRTVVHETTAVTTPAASESTTETAARVAPVLVAKERAALPAGSAGPDVAPLKAPRLAVDLVGSIVATGTRSDSAAAAGTDTAGAAAGGDATVVPARASPAPIRAPWGAMMPPFGSSRADGVLAFIMSLLPFAPSDGKGMVGPGTQLAILILLSMIAAYPLFSSALRDVRRRGPRGFATLALRPG